MPGLTDQLSVTGFGGDASWTGYAMIAGHWYSGPAEVVVNTAFLDDTDTAVGGLYTLTSGGGHTAVRIAGEVLDTAGGSPAMIGSISTLSALDPGLAPSHYVVELRPGTSMPSYLNALSSTLGSGYGVSTNTREGAALSAILGLVAALTLHVDQADQLVVRAVRDHERSRTPGPKGLCYPRHACRPCFGIHWRVREPALGLGIMARSADRVQVRSAAVPQGDRAIGQRGSRGPDCRRAHGRHANATG